MPSYFRNLLAMVRKPYMGAVPLFPAAQDLSWIPGPCGFTAPTGSVNGTNTVFVCSTDNPMLICNGLLLTKDIDYTMSGMTATFTVAPVTGSIVEEVTRY